MNIIVMADGHEINVEHGLGVITLEAVAHSLAQINRFNGHAARPYSVAEHSLLVVEILEREGMTSPHVLFAALMHDAHEAICGDLHSPGKSVIGPPWRQWEDRFEAMVRRTFRLITAMNECRNDIHRADLVALATERRDLMPNDPGMSAWPVLEGVQPVDWVRLSDPQRWATPWDFWRIRFLAKARDLCDARDQIAAAYRG